MKRKLANAAPWDRLLWGVLFVTPREKPLLIGELWFDSQLPPPYDGAPTQPLMFTTRKPAVEYCRRMHAKWKTNPSLKGWHVRPVRVRSHITVQP